MANRKRKSGVNSFLLNEKAASPAANILLEHKQLRNNPPERYCIFLPVGKYPVYVNKQITIAGRRTNT